jgi:mannitol 2-dehydrogenase
VDPLRDKLIEAARRQRSEATAFLANRDVFGDLIDQPRFVSAYTTALQSLHQRGARATLAELEVRS